jgi:hypothetical protein
LTGVSPAPAPRADMTDRGSTPRHKASAGHVDERTHAWSASHAVRVRSLVGSLARTHTAYYDCTNHHYNPPHAVPCMTSSSTPLHMACMASYLALQDCTVLYPPSTPANVLKQRRTCRDPALNGKETRGRAVQFLWRKANVRACVFLALCAHIVHRPILQIHCLIFLAFSRLFGVSFPSHAIGALLPPLHFLALSSSPSAAAALAPAARRAQPPAARASSAAAARGSSAATACVLQCCCRARHELSRARWIRRDPWRRPRRPRLDLWRGTR